MTACVCLLQRSAVAGSTRPARAASCRLATRRPTTTTCTAPGWWRRTPGGPSGGCARGHRAPAAGRLRPARSRDASGGRGRGRAVRGSPRLPGRRARAVLTGECERECDIGRARRRCCRARGPALRCLNSRVRVARPVSWAALSGQRAAGRTASHGRGGLGWAAGASPHGPLFFRPCWPVLSGGSGQTVQASAGVAAANVRFAPVDLGRGQVWRRALHLPQDEKEVALRRARLRGWEGHMVTL